MEAPPAFEAPPVLGAPLVLGAPPARKARSQKVSHLEISLCEPDEEFLLKLRETQPQESKVPLTLLLNIENNRSAISERVDLLKRVASQKPDNPEAERILKEALESLDEVKNQLRRHYSEWCWLQFEKVYADLGIGNNKKDNHVKEDPTALSITILGLSPEDRITFCQKMWHLECIDRIATNDVFDELKDDRLERGLNRVPEWTPDEGKKSITHRFVCSDADSAKSFAEEAVRIAKLWRQESHIEENTRSVTITVTTPSIKGLTPENIQYASSLSTIFDRRYSC